MSNNEDQRNHNPSSSHENAPVISRLNVMESLKEIILQAVMKLIDEKITNKFKKNVLQRQKRNSSTSQLSTG